MWKLSFLMLLSRVAVMTTKDLEDKGKNSISPPECPKQCEPPGCLSYTQVNSDLACKVIPVENNTEAIERDQVGNEHRTQYTKVIRSGSKYILCGKSSTETFKQQQNKGTRLFLVASNTRGTTYSEMDMNIHEVKPYPYLNIAKPTAVAYMSKRRKILLATTAKQIIATPLGTYGNENFLKRKILSFAIAVDEHNQFVFLGVQRPRCGLYRMTTDGRDFRLVVQVHHTVRSISPDPKYNRVFICTYRRIFYIFYDNGSLRVLTDTKKSYAITLNPDNNAIYYNDDTLLTKWSLSTGNKTVLSSLAKDFYDIAYYRGKLYFSYSKCIVLCIFKKHYCTSRKTDEIEFDGKLCIIQ